VRVKVGYGYGQVGPSDTVGLDHAQGVSAQAVVQAAGDRASRFRANGRRRRDGPARPLDRDDAAAGEEST